MTFKERWTDIVEMVHKKQVDLAVTGFSQTFKRSSLVDFSFPLTSISLRFVYTQSKMMFPELNYQVCKFWAKKLWFFSLETVGFVIHFMRFSKWALNLLFHRRFGKIYFFYILECSMPEILKSLLIGICIHLRSGWILGLVQRFH